MKRLFKQTFLFCSFIFSAAIYSQDYKIAGGLFVDLGTGTTAFGPHAKFFVNENFSVQPAVLFMEGGGTAIGADLSYNSRISGAPGLMWNVGAGPQVFLYSGNTSVALRPSLGLEYTISGAPLNIFFDWRPLLEFTNGTDFTAGRFGLGARFVFKK